MEVEQLTDEQIANLTREQIEMLENDPDQLMEILGSKPASGNGNGQPSVLVAGNPLDAPRASSTNGTATSSAPAAPDPRPPAESCIWGSCDRPPHSIRASATRP